MAETSLPKPAPANVPAGPKVSGTRTLVSLVALVLVLIVCAIELRAGLGHYLTLKAFNGKEVSENSLFKSVTLDAAKGMMAAFPSQGEVKKGDYEDLHHYYWFSLLRPLMGESSPEVFVTVDHLEPPNAISFYTSTEGELEVPPHDPNAPASAPPMGMGGMPGMMGGPGGPGGHGGGPGMDGEGGGRRRRRSDGDGGEDGKSGRPAMEGEEAPASTEETKAEPASTDPAPGSEPKVEPAKDGDNAAPASQTDSPAEPSSNEEKP